MPGWATAATDGGSEEYEENSDYFNRTEEQRTEGVDAKTEAGGVGEFKMGFSTESLSNKFDETVLNEPTFA